MLLLFFFVVVVFPKLKCCGKQCRIQDFPLGGADLRRGCFSAKTKELDPVLGGDANWKCSPINKKKKKKN